MGSITLITFIPANMSCELAELITRWKCEKRKCKTFRLLHHRVIELTGTNHSFSWVSAVDSQGGTIWIVDAHRGDGKRFVVRADEKLTAFLKLETAVRAGGAIVLDERTAVLPH